MSIQDLIASVSERLTPTERRLARLVLEDPTLLAFGTVSDLAARAETSRPSVVRFAAKLGFEGFSDLQGWSQAELSRRVASPSQRIRREPGSVEPVRRAVEDAVQHVCEALNGERVRALAAPIVRAVHVWILSGETSMAGAHVLHSGLSMARSGVHLVTEHDTGRDLSGAAAGDVAVVIDFARYRMNSITAAQTLAELGVEIVAITDGPLSPLASLTQTRCELRVPAAGPFDSSVPAVTAAELIVAEVVSQLGDAARERLDRLETLWQSTGTFLHYSPRGER